MMSPPQSPRARSPSGRSLVITMGAAAVPSATILPPRDTMRAPVVALSPKICVPGSMVRVAPLATNTAPWRR